MAKTPTGGSGEGTGDTNETVTEFPRNKQTGGSGGGDGQVPDIIGSAKKKVREAAKNSAEAKALDLYKKRAEHVKAIDLIDQELQAEQETLKRIYEN